MYYGDYLRIDLILSAQKLQSMEAGAPAHDEHLFIVVHQVYELWFKQILWELESIIALFGAPEVSDEDLSVALRRLGRMNEIQRILIDQVKVLETMTPLDFLDFRDLLTPASGFQSVQFRCLENRLGLRNRHPLGDESYKARLSPDDRVRVTDSESQPSLWELLEKWLERTPFTQWGTFEFWKIYESVIAQIMSADRNTIQNNATLSEDQRQRELGQLESTLKSYSILFNETAHAEAVTRGEWRLSFRATHAALLILLYRDKPLFQLPFSLINTLIELDEGMTSWRQRHALLAQRMIGTKIGTGGSSGAHYLQQALNKHKVFGDFANMATFLVPRSRLPPLPSEIEKQLGFVYRGPL